MENLILDLLVPRCGTKLMMNLKISGNQNLRINLKNVLTFKYSCTYNYI